MPADRETLLCVTIACPESARAAGLEALREVAEASRGRLVGTMTDGIFLSYATPDSAAGAAADIAAANATARVAVHAGRMSTDRNDRTMTRLLELVAAAQPGQILISQETAELLGTSFRAFSRRLRAARLARTGMYEILGGDAR
jgi:class 3 adenylate cyclase